MKSIVILAVIFLGYISSLASAVSPRFGAASVGVNDEVYITGGTLTHPLLFPPFPESYDEQYCDIQLWDGVTGKIDEGFTAPLMSCCRSHHTAVEYDGHIYLFGGAGKNNEVEYFNISSTSWGKVTYAGYEAPSGRYAHAAAKYENGMYIFGGIEAETSNLLNELWWFNFDTEMWTHIGYSPRHFVPSPRAGAQLVAIDNYLVLFGGLGYDDKFYNELWAFDTAASKWYHLTPEHSPLGRAAFGAIGAAGHLIIYGGATTGTSRQKVSYLNDVWSFHFQAVADAWNQEQVEPKINWFPLYVDPREPWAPARADFSHAVVGGLWNIFAGQDESRETRADVWSLHLKVLVVDESTPIKTHVYERLDNDTNWDQRSCWPGYEFPWCTLNCRLSAYCNGHGVCLPDGTCACDAGWKGDNCDYNVCDDYRGFSTEELNQILLPKSIESIFVKLDIIFNKLMYIRDLLPSIDQNDLSLREMGSKTFNFYRFCLVGDLCETTAGFENAIGCEEACGSETFCVVNDVCINGQCVGGHKRDCANEYEGNKCVNSWCDEEQGCMHSTVECVHDTELYPCSRVYCHPEKGCVHERMEINDDDCCTVDTCDALTNTVIHTPKCEDHNPCTIDVCNKECDFGTCHYTKDSCCFPSAGQNGHPFDSSADVSPRSRGDPIFFSPENMVPTQNWPIAEEPYGYFWLKGCGSCELVYEIHVNALNLDEELWEEGTNVYAAAPAGDLAGAVGDLPLGAVKTGVWNYCNAGVSEATLLAGEVYITIHFNKGDARAQLEFLSSWDA